MGLQKGFIDKEVEIGDRVRDKVTGFEGIAYGQGTLFCMRERHAEP